MIRLWSLAITSLVLTIPSSTTVGRPVATPRFPLACTATAPADIRVRPALWLGACVAGKAEGLGILRMGQRQPFAFLVGRMKSGRPASGLLFDTDKSYWTARGFDANGKVLIADGNYPKEQDQAWADAVLAARQVGDRFAKAGNAASAAYYRRFASEIENGRPE
ncbi:hypothetical protein [uncultured Sphingomonas sp.]|uniref:hypothetical protein n=1 Tax=uncultured Sphingomonas sp. TaxID=158754 RepID=UPI0025FAC44A|nr:hypothetical protein [uncultured Sphingomonas sp.]